VRRKVVALLVGAAVIPLVAAALFQIRATRARLIEASADLLGARADQLRRQLETLELGYQRTADKIARGPAIASYRTDPAPVRAVLSLDVSIDRDLLAVGVVTVQRIVQRHRGEIWADATPDRGAAFSFTLGEPS
jgi:light-regulated signal transduction histidine kinase (bacteriophytochrome)